MNKDTRRSLLVSRLAAIRLGSSLAVAGLAAIRVQSNSDDRDASRRINQVMKERLPAMDDSIMDCDKIEATVSRIQFDSETDGQGWVSSATLTRAEKLQLAREVAPFKQFRADVAALPLLLTA